MAKKTPTGTVSDQHSLGIGVEKLRVPEWDPRCYDGGNGPNPYLAEWMAEHATPYDAATDTYRREALTGIIEATKATAIYGMHTYDSKKPHDAIMQYIEHYTEPGDVVLDPFCGSGSTALSALMLGRKAIAIDLSPAATFITKNYCWPVDPDRLLGVFAEVKQRVASEMQRLYGTRCHRCGGRAVIEYTIYSEVFECLRCGKQVPRAKCVKADGRTAKGKHKTVSLCPSCREPFDQHRDLCVGTVPVLTRVRCEGQCRPAASARADDDSDEAARRHFAEYDLPCAEKIAADCNPFWHPTAVMMHAPESQERWGLLWRPYHRDIRRVSDFYTARNLRAVGAWLGAMRGVADRDYQDALLFALHGILKAMSRLQGHVEDPRFPNQLMRGTYYVPPVGREYNVGDWLGGKIANLTAGYRRLRALRIAPDVVVSTQSATSLGSLAAESVDYVFTDPAYGDTMQFGETSFLGEAWLGFDTHWHDQEIVVNEVRGQDEGRWFRLMLDAMRECQRVLKPGRWLSLCYHDTSEGTWDLVQQVMEEAGFIPDTAEEAVAIDAIQKSYNQLQADQVLKRDLVINFRKPYPGERPLRVRVAFAPGDTPELFEQKVITILHAFLTRYPGSTRDVIWDAVVSRLVRQGDMERHDFDAILRQVAAPNEAGEWYLTVDEAEDIGDSEAAKADAAAAALEKVIARHCEDTGSEGMDYSDILEWYVVQYRGDRPSRQLTDWLPDYLFQAPAGGYRNPASDAEREQKRVGRESGLNRLIRRYLRAPASVEPAPDQASLCDWLRHCYRAGLYEEGCRLVDEGHIRLVDLPAETQGDVEDDAAMCRSRLRQRAEIARVEKPAKKTRARKPKPEQQELGL